MNNISILNSIRNAIADSMQSEIYNCAMYMNTLANVNTGYNTTNNYQFSEIPPDGIRCDESLCGTEGNPQPERCKDK